METAKAHYGVVPVENSTEGMVNHTLDCFMASAPEISICAEVELPIHHAFLVHPDNSGAVERIVSHSQSLAQCRGWLDTRYPGVERLAVVSNAEAARQVAKNPKLGAVAGEIAAQRYGLTVLADRIEDQTGNKTRFWSSGGRMSARAAATRPPYWFPPGTAPALSTGCSNPFIGTRFR